MLQKQKKLRRNTQKLEELLARQGQEGGPKGREIKHARKRLAKSSASFQKAKNKARQTPKRVRPVEPPKQSHSNRPPKDDDSDYVPSLTLSDHGANVESTESEYVPSIGDVDTELEFVPNDPQNGDASATPHLLLGDLPADQEAEQQRVFGWRETLTERSHVRCVSCHAPHHMMREICPLRRCRLCGKVDSHWYRACPTHGRCERCRRRGHREEQCSETSMLAPCAEEPCEVCDSADHTERACPFRYRGYKPASDVSSKKARRIRRSCYKCASDQHWGDDCPELTMTIRTIRLNSGTPWNENWVAHFVKQGPAANGVDCMVPVNHDGVSA